MLKSVEYVGQGFVDPDGQTLVVGGPTGPKELSRAPGDVHLVFLAGGWDPNDSPEGEEDERIGQGLARLMATVGNAGADGKYDAVEIANLVAALDPKFAAKTHLGDVLEVSQQVFDAVGNDGKVDLVEGIQITQQVAGALGVESVSDAAGLVTGLVGKLRAFMTRNKPQ